MDRVGVSHEMRVDYTHNCPSNSCVCVYVLPQVDIALALSFAACMLHWIHTVLQK